MENARKAVIYARCSTDENRQDVEVQLAELRRYAQAFGWGYDEVWEYDSGFKGEQPKLQAVLKRIRRKDPARPLPGPVQPTGSQQGQPAAG